MSAVIKETHHGGCPHDCPDTCSMVFEVEDGKLTGVKGNPDHPMTRGGLCVKLKDYENVIIILIAFYTQCVALAQKAANNLNALAGTKP